MRLSLLALPVLALVLHAGSVPFAYGGVLNSPDAYLLQHTEIGIGVGATSFTMEDSTGDMQNKLVTAGFLDVGLFGYGQVGVSYLGDGGVVANLKIMVLKEGLDVPAFAIGCENMMGAERVDVYTGPPGSPDSTGVIPGYYDEDGNYNYDHSQNWSAYGVASKSMRYLIGVPVTLNLGIGVGRFVGIIDGGALGIGSSWANGLFGSVVWEPSNAVTVAFEQDGRDLNFGISYDVNKYFSLNLAIAELEMAMFPPDGRDPGDPAQNAKFSLAVTSNIGPLFGGPRNELEREQQRIARARARLEELESRRRAAEAELQRLRDLLDESR